ncbi:MAG: glycosyltransferase family 1 protein [Bacteroidetes bacterium]|nr:MAG: glycosyltransferase family 1 protein [Bacteroidota bacterium]
MTVNHPEIDFFFLFDRPYSKQFIFNKNVHPVTVFPQARHPLLYYWWFEFSLPRVFKQIQPDVFFSPEGYLSLKSDVPQVNVIHDLNFEHYPHFLPASERAFYRKFFPRYARKAKKIITVSEFSKQDIIHKYNVSSEKISVVYNGVSSSFHSVSDSVKQSVRKQYAGGKPYFFYVGAIHERKNIANMLKAFDLFKKQTGSNIRFLLAGNKKWWSEHIQNTYQNLSFKDEVTFLGRVEDDELNRLLAASEGLMYVSFFEGFGLPVLEAMQCNVPVLTSNCSSLPEIGGDAVFYANPGNIKDIADKMKLIWENKVEAANRKKRYVSVLQKFDWDKSSERIFEILISTS